MLLNPYRFAAVDLAYLNPSDRSSDVLLSDSNRTAARANTAQGWRSGRSYRAYNSGKRYFEWVAVSNSNGGMIGVAPSGLSVTTQYPGQTSTSFGYYYNSTGGEVYTNSIAYLTGSGVVATGSYARVAVDFDAGKIWFGNASSWKSSGDPATGVGETFSFTPGAELYMCVGLNRVGNSGTLRSKSSQVSGAIPSGFTCWDD